MCFSVQIVEPEDYIENIFKNIKIENKISPLAAGVSGPTADKRIFPNYFSPILTKDQDSLYVENMRYSAYLPSYIEEDKAKNLTTFNARRDNLNSKFWSHAFLKKHGFIVVNSFFEWVKVKDLLSSKKITEKQVCHIFEQQKQARYEKWIQTGKDPKKYKPTKTEQTNHLLRRILINFKSESWLVCPVIISKDKNSDNMGFAIVTDEPTNEIRSAGHDRSPIVLEAKNALEWLYADTIDKARVIVNQQQKRLYKFDLAIS